MQGPHFKLIYFLSQRTKEMKGKGAPVKTTILI